MLLDNFTGAESTISVSRGDGLQKDGLEDLLTWQVTESRFRIMSKVLIRTNHWFILLFTVQRLRKKNNGIRKNLCLLLGKLCFRIGTGRPKKKIRLATFSNSDSVELILNGKSLGVKKMIDYPEMLMDWEVLFEPGILRAVARKKDKIVAEHELKTAGTAKKIMLIPDHKTILANGMDLCQLTVLVTDSYGNVVPNTTNKITFEITGEGKNIGVDNGDLHSNEPYVASSRTVYNGRAFLVIRPTTIPGKIIVTASAIGLSPSTLSIKSTKELIK